MRKLVLPIIVILLIFIPFLWYRMNIAPADSSNTTAQMFVVQNGEGVNSIAEHLKSQNLIKSARAFELLTKLEGLSSKIQAGSFRLSPSMDAETVAKSLTHGSLDIWITVPEGKRADEIAANLKDKMPLYTDSWKTTLEQNEGYLFPDTYLFPREATIDQIVQIMKQNFDKNYAQASKTVTTSFNQQQAVILASLIEREGKTDSDRPLIASVFYNRLNLGMPLQVDATIQYVIGTSQNWWPQLPNSGSFVVPDSPYNSYTHNGLPPTPICNPGEKALEAALNPAKSNYIFYIADSHGVTHFAKTLDEQNANIKKYGL